MSYITNIKDCLDVVRTAIQSHVSNTKDLEDKGEERLELCSKFLSVLKKQTAKIYSYLNYSVLTGEYIIFENLGGEIDGIIEEASSLLECLPETSYTQESENLLSVIQSIKNDLKRYKSRIDVFWIAIENPYKNLLQIREDLKDADNSAFMNIKDYSDVFFINLVLMYVDSNFSLSNGAFYHLIRDVQHLNGFKKKIQEPYIEAILAKIQLLVCKFRYKDNHKRQEASYYITDGKKDQVDINKLPDTDLGERIGKINTRDTSSYKYNIRQYYEKIDIPKTTFDFFVLCHYYKNVEPNYTLLKKVEDDFMTYAESVTSKYERANIKVCENYFRNCRLSLLLKQDSMTLAKVKGELDNIQTLQLSTQYDDYFPYSKVAEWELARLRNGIGISEKIEILENLLKDAKGNLDKAQQCLNVTKHNDGCFIPFRPFYDDCISHISVEDELIPSKTLPLFCLSSFVLPVDHEREERKVADLYTEYARLSASVEARKTVNRIYGELKDEGKELKGIVANLKTGVDSSVESIKEQVKEDLNSNQRTVIEILSVFAAIVIFASGSIQILSKSSDVILAGKYMLLFSSGLGVMGVLMSCLFRRSESWNKRDTWCLVFCAFIVILSGISLFFLKQDSITIDDVKDVIRKETIELKATKEPLKIEATIDIKEEKSNVAPTPAKKK